MLSQSNTCRSSHQSSGNFPLLTVLTTPLPPSEVGSVVLCCDRVFCNPGCPQIHHATKDGVDLIFSDARITGTYHFSVNVCLVEVDSFTSVYFTSLLGVCHCLSSLSLAFQLCSLGPSRGFRSWHGKWVLSRRLPAPAPISHSMFDCFSHYRKGAWCLNILS